MKIIPAKDPNRRGWGMGVGVSVCATGEILKGLKRPLCVSVSLGMSLGCEVVYLILFKSLIFEISNIKFESFLPLKL